MHLAAAWRCASLARLTNKHMSQAAYGACAETAEERKPWTFRRLGYRGSEQAVCVPCLCTGRFTSFNSCSDLQ